MDIRNYFYILWAKYKRHKVIKNYLESYPIRKLEIGAGPTIHDGWLSTDNRPGASSMYLDVTNRFPFDNNLFDYIYSEHMIEHITWQEGLFMLKECNRVLKPNGTIRIATPDLGAIIGLYNNNSDPSAERYIKWITDRYLWLNIYKASFVINNAFRNWHHRFLYDGELLELALNDCGFTNIHRCSVGESSDVNLQGKEAHGKKIGDEEMATFETMVFEGTCNK